MCAKKDVEEIEREKKDCCEKYTNIRRERKKRRRGTYWVSLDGEKSCSKRKSQSDSHGLKLKWVYDLRFWKCMYTPPPPLPVHVLFVVTDRPKKWKIASVSSSLLLLLLASSSHKNGFVYVCECVCTHVDVILYTNDLLSREYKSVNKLKTTATILFGLRNVWMSVCLYMTSQWNRIHLRK